MSDKKPLEFWLGLWTLILFAAAAGVALYRPKPAKAKLTPSALTLRATDEAGRMRIDWDTAAAAIRSADEAVLEVEDGGQITKYPVDAKILRSGGLDYMRKSPDVLLTLTLLRDGKAADQAAIRSVGPPVMMASNEPFDRRPAAAPSRTSRSRNRRR